MAENTEYAERQFVALGIIGFLGYGSYYLLWHQITPGAYNSFLLRFIAMLLCLGLVVKKYWPEKLRSFMPIYWYFTLFYLFPFFYSFLLFKNNFSNIWVQSSMMALFCLVILTDWLSLVVLLAIGIAVGWIAYTLTSNTIYLPPNLLSIIIAYAAVLTTGGFFIYNKDTLLKEKLRAMRTLSVDIAHELRTPLATISMGANGIKEYLSDLIGGYRLASDANLPVRKIRPAQLELLESVLDDIVSETNYSNTIINMLLIKSEQLNLKHNELDVCTIKNCVEEALHRYPFQDGERELIEWNSNDDFTFKGKALLTEHLLFNLLKNAIYYVKSAGKGKIQIWLERGDEYNKLYFRDTGTGIAPDVLPNIFDLFFTKTYHGSGIGLAFCKMVMQSYKGKIVCKSIQGEFTEFILSFPAFPQ